MKAEGLIHKDVGHCMNKNLRDFLRTHSASSTSTQVQNRVRSIQSLQKHSSSLINMKSKSMPETTSDHWSSVLENGDSSLTMSLEEEIRLIGLPSVTGSSEEVPDSRSITSTSSDENVSSSDLWEQDDKTMNDRVISVDLNIKGNKTPFARVPLNRDVDSLRYIRDYIGNRLKLSDLLTCEKSNSTSVKFSYNFLSQHGVRIHLSQEREILAMSQVVTRKTRNSERSHIFIVLNNTEMPPPSLPSRKRHREDDEDSDDDDDDHDDNDSDNFNRKLTKRFHGAPRSVQSRLALEYIQSQLSNSSSSEQLSSSDQGSGAFLRDTDSLLIVATSRNMLEVVRDVDVGSLSLSLSLS
jgi:hypothetical protein